MSIGLWLLSPTGAALELGVVLAILRGRHYRRFPLVLALCAFGFIWLVLTSFAVNPSHVGVSMRTYALIYWVGNFVGHGLILSLILTLIGQAVYESRAAASTTLVLALAVVAFGLGSLAVLHGQRAWQTALSRNLSFCEEVLNFILWAFLVRSRGRDILLLMVSAGIGLQVTGEVIGHTIRIYAAHSSILWLPDAIVVASEMLSLAIWLYAFWTAPPDRVKPAANSVLAR